MNVLFAKIILFVSCNVNGANILMIIILIRMEVLKNPQEPSELLPDEMIVYVLSFIDANKLLDCRLVCKRWQELLDSYVFQEKASRQNKYVNNGRGYVSFSEIDSNNVRKLELPWYVFYVICKYDPFNRNLVKNHCGQSKLVNCKIGLLHLS